MIHNNINNSHIVKIKNKPTSSFQPYIGFDIARSSAKFGDDPYVKRNNEDYFKDSNNSIRFTVGIKYKYIGIETFYQTAENGTKNNRDLETDYNTTKIQSNYTSYGADLLGYIPLSQEIELLASVGLAQYDFDTSTSTTIKSEEMIDGKGTGKYFYNHSKTLKDFKTNAVRFGLGVQYNMENKFAIRAMANYITPEDNDYIKNMIKLSLGIRYML